MAIKSSKRDKLQYEGVNLANLQNYEVKKIKSPHFKKTRSKNFLMGSQSATGLEIEVVAEDED